VRYDKYDGVTGGFRATAAAVMPGGEADKLVGAALDANGLMVTGAAGNSGFVGVVIRDRTKRRAGDRQDIMTHGEVVLDSDETQLVAGTKYYLNATTGALQTTETRYMVGQTVEAWRLVVRFSDQGAA
jgi:hypothetical protein